jgi:hypothetical protein
MNLNDKSLVGKRVLVKDITSCLGNIYEWEILEISESGEYIKYETLVNYKTWCTYSERQYKLLEILPTPKKSKKSKEPVDFLEEIKTLSKEYKYSLSHEDNQGAFIIEDYKEDNIKWLSDALIKTKESKPCTLR